MHSHTSVSLLLLFLVTVTAQESRLDTVQFRARVPSRLPMALKEEEDRGTQAVFRIKETRPCECLNGGRCNIKERKCECSFGFTGARCEISALNDHDTIVPQDVPAAASGLQQSEKQRVVLFAARPPFNLTDWLFYLPLFAALVLMATLVRVLVILTKSYLGEKVKSLTVTVVAQPLRKNSVDNEPIYTLPLPIQPPSYNEATCCAPFPAAAVACPAHFVHSTPFKGCSGSAAAAATVVQMKEPEYLCPTKRFDEYTVIV